MVLYAPGVVDTRNLNAVVAAHPFVCLTASRHFLFSIQTGRPPQLARLQRGCVLLTLSAELPPDVLSILEKGRDWIPSATTVHQKKALCLHARRRACYKAARNTNVAFFMRSKDVCMPHDPRHHGCIAGVNSPHSSPMYTAAVVDQCRFEDLAHPESGMEPTATVSIQRSSVLACSRNRQISTPIGQRYRSMPTSKLGQLQHCGIIHAASLQIYAGACVTNTTQRMHANPRRPAEATTHLAL